MELATAIDTVLDAASQHSADVAEHDEAHADTVDAACDHLNQLRRLVHEPLAE